MFRAVLQELSFFCKARLASLGCMGRSVRWGPHPVKGQKGVGTSLTHPPVVAQTVKRLSRMWETWVRSLGQEDPLEKEMAIHSSTIAWKIPWTEEPGRLQSMGSKRVGHD